MFAQYTSYFLIIPQEAQPDFIYPHLIPQRCLLLFFLSFLLLFNNYSWSKTRSASETVLTQGCVISLLVNCTFVGKRKKHIYIYINIDIYDSGHEVNRFYTRFVSAERTNVTLGGFPPPSWNQKDVWFLWNSLCLSKWSVEHYGVTLGGLSSAVFVSWVY